MTTVAIGCFFLLAGILIILLKVYSILKDSVSSKWFLAVFIVATIAIASLLYFSYEKIEKAKIAENTAIEEAKIAKEAEVAGVNLTDYKNHIKVPREELMKRLENYAAQGGIINKLDVHCQQIWAEHQTKLAAKKTAAQKIAAVSAPPTLTPTPQSEKVEASAIQAPQPFVGWGKVKVGDNVHRAYVEKMDNTRIMLTVYNLGNISRMYLSGKKEANENVYKGEYAFSANGQRQTGSFWLNSQTMNGEMNKEDHIPISLQQG